VPTGRAVVPILRERPRRIATLSVHTSPLDQPGTGDAGGLNVYIVEIARRLADLGVQTEIFTRATASDLPAAVQMEPGILVRHVTAGPYEGLDKTDLPAQLCAFTSGVLRAEAQQEPGWYDIVHSHYWLSGQVGRIARQRWGVPLVHTAHTLAKVKNVALADGDCPEPLGRLIGEDQVVADADLLIASTGAEARQLGDFYGADPGRIIVVPPGVDLEMFRLGAASTARTRLGVPPDAVVLLFVGRIQPLKAPDMLLRAAAVLAEREPGLRDRLHVLVVGGASGSGLAEPERLRKLAVELGIADLVHFHPPAAGERLADFYRAADVTVVPSHNESFGLVALESQACGTPVVAAAVGGLPTAVGAGTLVHGRDPADYAAAIAQIVTAPRARGILATAARAHAEEFSWRRTAQRLLAGYRDALAQPPFLLPEAAGAR
jgi:D-inositol-3-phosphate glycosyltransferase